VRKLRVSLTHLLRASIAEKFHNGRYAEIEILPETKPSLVQITKYLFGVLKNQSGDELPLGLKCADEYEP
jgi:hypothetical protein